MKRLHEGWDYKLYQVYIWGGLAAIVIYIVVAVLVFDTPGVPGSSGFLVTIGPMVVWFFGILLYWWWVFLFKGNEELKGLVQEAGTPAINSLKSWNTLHQAMAIHGGSVAEYISNAKKANIPVIIWFGLTNLGPIWIFGFIILGSVGIIPMAAINVLAIGVMVWVGIMLIGTYILLGWGSRSAEKAYLTPLGLSLTENPRISPEKFSFLGGGQLLMPDGAAVVEGERHGHLVHIATIARNSLTYVQAALPPFNVQSTDGKLTPDKKSPERIVEAARRLRKAKRWQGIDVQAGPEGIAIQRESKGTNMWLYDLWLAEYFVESHRSAK